MYVILQALMTTMKTAGKTELDEQMCDAACKDGEKLIDQLSAITHMI